MAVTFENVTKQTLPKLRIPPFTFQYNSKDAILYALGVGITTHDEHGLRYLYENSEDFQVLPSFASMMGFKEDVSLQAIPGLKIRPECMLHLEQYIEQHRPLPKECSVSIQLEYLDVLDRSIGAQYIYRTTASDNRGPLFTLESSVFVTGDGKFGGKPRTEKPVAKIELKPNGEPDAVLEHHVDDQQNVLFRLSGDFHPLHINPEAAKKAKFNGPILHGNCTMGIAAQLILKKYADSDARRFKCMMPNGQNEVYLNKFIVRSKVRFAQIVYPGDTLRVSTWKRGNRINFEARTKEAEDAVLTGGYVDLLDKPMQG